MKHTLFLIVLILLLAVNCNNEPDPFLIQKQNIGLLTDSTQVKDLDAVFKNDSVVRYIAGDEFTDSVNSIEIYEKGGEKLLDLSPKEALDSTSVIYSVRIIDDRYKTEKDISALSTFKDIKDAYTIRKIDNLISSVVVSVKEIDATFTIDKKELPAGLRFDTNSTIDAIQIPDKAKVKFFMVYF